MSSEEIWECTSRSVSSVNARLRRHNRSRLGQIQGRCGPKAKPHYSTALQEQKFAKLELFLHVRWWPKDKDNFVSWTSSLLFAIQYIYYRNSNVRSPNSNFNNIELYVLDMARFPKGVFLQDLDLIAAYSAFDSQLAVFQELRQGAYYFGEYLSQGSLRIEDKCQIVTAASIVRAGLSSLVPEPSQLGWAKLVLRHRDLFYSGSPRGLNSAESNAIVHPP